MSRFLIKKDSKKDSKSLQIKLMSMLREYFNLRVQLRMGQLKQSHLLCGLRRNIASIKTIISKTLSK